MKKFFPLFFSFLFCLPSFSAADSKTSGSEVSLDSVMTAMADWSDGTGVWLVDWLKEKNAIVKFDASIKTPGAFRVEGTGPAKRPVILINEDIRPRTDGYKYYSALIAREAGELIHIGMPDSAEKRYMINSCAAEVFFEMYGTRSELPVFGGVRDEELAGQITSWVEDGPDSGPETIALRTGVKLLKTQISETELALSQAAQDGTDTAVIARKLAALKSSQAYYGNEFQAREKYWWSMHQPQ